MATMKLTFEDEEANVEGNILVICEENTYRNLASGFKHAVHTIIERQDRTYVIRKNREDTPPLADFYQHIDSIYRNFNHVILVLERTHIITLRTEDLIGEKALSNWYKERRGYFTGKNFGI